MALPQNVSEQLSRVPIRAPGVSGQLLMLTCLLFFISLASYVGLEYGYKPYLEGEIQKLDKSIADYTAQISPAEQSNLINFYSQLTNLKTLLAGHIFGSRFFEWIEKNTQINVSYQNLRFDAVQGTISVTGQAKTIDDIGEQVLILNQLPEVKKITLSGITAAPNKLWQFNLAVTIDPKLVIGQTLPAN
ncbi:MAG: hypothetical protein AAB738_02850 [Patescibacteria group bacterium]